MQVSLEDAGGGCGPLLETTDVSQNREPCIGVLPVASKPSNKGDCHFQVTPKMMPVFHMSVPLFSGTPPNVSFWGFLNVAKKGVLSKEDKTV